jgi:hypothetical protein
VRREAGGAARVLAGHLERMADKLDPLHPSDPLDEQNRTRGL